MRKSLLLMTALFAASPALAVEELAYEVVRSTPDFEVRQYRSYAVVETSSDGELDSARDAAFERLFKYISGSNRAQQKIEMTVPVVVKPAGRATETPLDTRPAVPAGTSMQFVLPSRFDASKAPHPADSDVRIRDVAAQSIAARKFSGRPSESNLRDNEAKLMAAVQDAGLVAMDAPRFAFYDPPFTPWFMRRNEVLVPVQGTR